MVISPSSQTSGSHRIGPSVASERCKTLLAVLSLVLLPMLVKSPLLLGVLDADSMRNWARLSPVIPRRLIWGAPTIEPNIGITSHALGSLAARLWTAGTPPWWNPFEGVGAPLAGEMQSAALFPPTLLMLLPGGQLIEHLLFQIVAGLATYALLRRLGAGRTGAWLGGTAFAFNGAFAWLANAAINPICFLPVVVLGIEMLATPAQRAARAGGVLVALGLAGSLYAGFPEVAYLDGLLIGAWTIVRATTFPRDDALRFLGRVALFGTCGLLLATPILTAFGDYLKVADTGMHGADVISNGHLEARHGILLLLPYLSSTIFSKPAFWGATGGYAGLSLCVLALAGATAPRGNRLRSLLAAWVAVSLGATYDVPPFLALFHLLPMTRLAALYRYLDGSWLFAMSVLAGLAVDDLTSGREGTRRLGIGLFVTGPVVLILGLLGWSGGVGLNGKVGAASCVLQAAVLTVMIAAWRWPGPNRPHRATVVAAAAAVEIVALFATPLASYPRSIPIEMGGVRFLQRHLGLQRFVTLGPIAPNYGSYFGIAQVNHNDLPVPRDWVAYARRRLDPAIDPVVLNPPSAASLLANLPRYAAIGTRYAVAPAAKPLPGLTERYADPVMRIYEVPGTTPYLAAPFCTVAAGGRTEIDLTCARASRLARLELLMPGWSVTVNGREAPLLRAGEIFQAVSVPAGRVHLSFRFRPPHLSVGLWLGGLGVLLLGIGLAWVGGPSRSPSWSRARSHGMTVAVQSEGATARAAAVTSRHPSGSTAKSHRS